MNERPNQLFAERIKILYESAPSAIPINLIIGAILGLFMLPVLKIERILAWWLVMFAVTVFRLIHVKYWTKRADWYKQAKRLEIEFSFLSLVTGLTWVSAFFFFAFNVPEVYLVFIIFALGGMCVGAIASLGSSKLAFFCYIVPMSIPPIVVFTLDGTALGYAMSGMLMIYTMSISLTFSQGYDRMVRSIKTQLEKDDLVQSLKVSNQDLELANEKIMILSYTDMLTQVSNRRHLDMMFTKEWKRARRFGVPICFVMVDIDFFKNYNDVFGHQQGDHCLQEISTVLRSIMKRPGDFVARYGGEEFAIILPDTTLEAATLLMKEVQTSLAQLRIPAGDTSVNPFVTLSFGIANITPKNGESAETLIAAADKELYRAKEHGRNRIESIQLSSE